MKRDSFPTVLSLNDRKLLNPFAGFDLTGIDISSGILCHRVHCVELARIAAIVTE